MTVNKGKGGKADSQQLTLPISFPPDFSFDTFVTCDGNHQALLAVRALAESPTNGSILYLYGESGTGKTHLFEAFIASVGSGLPSPASNCLIVRLKDDRNRNGLPTGLEPLAFQAAAVLFEDVQFLSAIPDGDNRLFGLFNIAMNLQRPLLISSDRHPRDIGGLHERLISRFLAGTVIHIGHLDETTCSCIIRKIATDRGIQLSEAVISYLIKRMPRRMDALQPVFEALDHRSMQLKRPITIGLVRDILELDSRIHDDPRQDTSE